jgi:hypothetical protein
MQLDPDGKTGWAHADSLGEDPYMEELPRKSNPAQTAVTHTGIEALDLNGSAHNIPKCRRNQWAVRSVLLLHRPIGKREPELKTSVHNQAREESPDLSRKSNRTTKNKLEETRPGATSRSKQGTSRETTRTHEIKT